MSDTKEVLAPFTSVKRDSARSIADGECDSVYTGITALPANTTVAMAYVPFQLCTTVYDAQTALEAGTLFPVLDKPWGRL